MKLIDKFIDNFPSSENKYLLKRKMLYNVPPCLFYGRHIDCQKQYNLYDLGGCSQGKYMKCWEQEQQAHLPQGITEKMLEKFNKFY